MLSKASYEELLLSSTFKKWSENTINEHPIPLKHTWEWLCNEGDKLSPKDVWDHFKSHPMIIVLKREDDRLSSAGLRSSSSTERYKNVGIEIIKLDKGPEQIWKECHS